MQRCRTQRAQTASRRMIGSTPRGRQTPSLPPRTTGPIDSKAPRDQRRPGRRGSRVNLVDTSCQVMLARFIAMAQHFVELGRIAAEHWIFGSLRDDSHLSVFRQRDWAEEANDAVFVNAF